MGSRPGLLITKKDALDSQPQVMKFTSCLLMVGGSLRVFRLLPPLKTGRHDIAESGIKHQNQIIWQIVYAVIYYMHIQMYNVISFS